MFAGRAVGIMIHAGRLCLVGTGCTVLCVDLGYIQLAYIGAQPLIFSVRGSTLYVSQILTYKDGPRKLFTMGVDP